MNTIIFLCGAGCGALAATLSLIVILVISLRNRDNFAKQSAEQHKAMIESLNYRNYLLEQQNQILRDK